MWNILRFLDKLNHELKANKNQTQSALNTGSLAAWCQLKCALTVELFAVKNMKLGYETNASHMIKKIACTTVSVRSLVNY